MYVSVDGFKKHVPELSVKTIRRLCREGKLACIWSGTRVKINLEPSLELLNGITEKKEDKDDFFIPPKTEFHGRPPDKIRLAEKEKIACAGAQTTLRKP